LKLILASIRLPCSRVIDNPLHTALIMSMSFQTSNSGAFRSLHCLIYKVLAPFRVRCGTFTILPQVFRFVKYFFRLFSKSFFVPDSLGPLARKLSYLTTASRVCQPLFSLFSKLFSKALFPSAPSATARLIYQIPPLLSTPFSIFFQFLLLQHILHCFPHNIGFTVPFFSVYLII